MYKKINIQKKLYFQIIKNNQKQLIMKKTSKSRQQSKLEIHEMLGVFQIDYLLKILDYIYKELIKNIYKIASRIQLKKKLKLNYLNPYFFIELIEIQDIDNKF